MRASNNEASRICRAKKKKEKLATQQELSMAKEKIVQLSTKNNSMQVELDKLKKERDQLLMQIGKMSSRRVLP
jgi:seryl-tRNA synthetase